ncbi:aldehyde dehydrogenase family protein [Shigella sonnei]|uniref:aldehyde dehydrogenase family protein n=1 Tax=Shigella sonnei TaxID=624 RepID=UPI0007352C99|nr:aldehyde dehydrogenase family protein [Shigella sonnei]
MTITPATHAISINPATGEQLSVLPWAGANDIENALELAAAGFRDWRETNIDYRAEKMRDIGKALRARSEEMAQMITREMGKPINQARAECNQVNHLIPTRVLVKGGEITCKILK